MLLHQRKSFKLSTLGIVFACVVVSIIIYFCAPSFNDEADYLQVKVSQGILEGHYRRTIHNLKFASFEGIPYAQPPIGKLRFKDPLPALPWDGTRKSINAGPECVQNRDKAIVGTEDCLVLNVYSPNVAPEEVAPVMVWIHGGAFASGSSNSFNHPDLFIRENVVLVTVNFRLGIFGYLCLDTKEVPGNAAMKDKVMALKWVRDNIEHFGGDRNSVTVFGHSSGGAAVSLLQVSPMAKHLIHGVISMSGVNLNDWAIQKNHAETVNLLVNYFKLNRYSLDLLEQLQSFTTEDIHKGAMWISDANYMEGFKELAFAPVIEREFNNSEAFLSKRPIEYLKTGNFSHISCIFGYTSFEYAYFYDEKVISTLDNIELMLSSKFNVTDVQLIAKIVEKIKDFYWGSQSFNPYDKDMLIGGISLVGDLMFFNGIDEAVKVNAKHSNESTFYFRFSYRGKSLGNSKIEDLGIQGATHCDPAAYLFPSENNIVDEQSSDGWVRKRMIKMFTNFARTKNPTPHPHTDLLPTVWLPVTRDEVRYLEINGDNTLSMDPESGRLAFWRDLEKFVKEQLIEKSRNGL